jgi:hypothetical protein
MGRNAAELRAAATATGWFNGPNLQYIGDGYSVPWQTGYIIGPGFAGSMWIYKAYLDANYLEYSRLHDWLYTPYGPELIQCTQDEADRALREELATESTVDANIVYTACSTFGAPYFGVSTVGYVQPSLPPGGDNMPPTAPTRGNGMADYKVVLIFQQTTTGDVSSIPNGYTPIGRTGGWSESYYDANTSLPYVLARLKGPRPGGPSPIAQARAQLLSSAGRLVMARIYEVGVGRGQPYALGFAGASGAQDVPNIALLMATELTATPTVRRWTLRGIPDAQVVNGEFAPTSNFGYALRVYTESMLETSVRGRVPQVKRPVFNISNAGLVTLNGVANPWIPNAIVTIQNAVTTEGLRRGGQYMISAVGPALNQFTLQGWQWGACTDGFAFQQAYAWYPVGLNDTKAVRITTHKIGRPSVSFRGRKSKRRIRS